MQFSRVWNFETRKLQFSSIDSICIREVKTRKFQSHLIFSWLASQLFFLLLLDFDHVFRSFLRFLIKLKSYRVVADVFMSIRSRVGNLKMKMRNRPKISHCSLLHWSWLTSKFSAVWGKVAHKKTVNFHFDVD